MDKRKIKIFVKIYWAKILIGFVIFVFLVALIFLLVVGTKHFLSLESFYKKMTLAAVPLQLFLSVITAFVFATIYMSFHYWFMFGGGMSKMGQKKIKAKDVDIKWSDVVGMESEKKEVWEVISLIKDRSQLRRVGGKIIKGILMVGAPGCGKTYLAKAIATETGLPFLATVGSEFIGMFVGVGAARIKSLFKEARVLAEIHSGCLVFIDEIDTIARPRVAVSGLGGGMSYNATVNQLLTEMDGLRQTDLRSSGSISNAFFKVMVGSSGTSLAISFTLLKGTLRTLPTSLIAILAFIVPKVMICATLSLPYFFNVYSITSERLLAYLFRNTQNILNLFFSKIDLMLI